MRQSFCLNLVLSYFPYSTFLLHLHSFLVTFLPTCLFPSICIPFSTTHGTDSHAVKSPRTASQVQSKVIEGGEQKFNVLCFVLCRHEQVRWIRILLYLRFHLFLVHLFSRWFPFQSTSVVSESSGEADCNASRSAMARRRRFPLPPLPPSPPATPYGTVRQWIVFPLPPFLALQWRSATVLQGAACPFPPFRRACVFCKIFNIEFFLRN